MAEALVTRTEVTGVSVLRLNRPGRHNALVPELLEALLEALRGEEDGQSRAIVLAAAGVSFSTGGDLREFHRHREDIRAYAKHLVGLLNQAILALYRHPATVICAVQGYLLYTSFTGG